MPSDLSTAVFLIGATLVLPDSSLMLHNVGLNPTRARVLDFFNSIGAPVRITTVQMRNGELVGDVSVRYAPIEGGTISGSQVAEMIDELPMLAALGPYTEKGIEIHDAQELRVKESDRIAALAEGLRQMGARVEEFPDGLSVEGRSAGKIARGEGRSARRSPNRHGAGGGGAGRGREYDDSGRGMRGGLVSGIFLDTRSAARRGEEVAQRAGENRYPGG